LRAIRKQAKSGALVAISAVDPLNLTGVILPGERIPAVLGNRILFEDGVPIAALDAGDVRLLGDTARDRGEIEAILLRKTYSPALRARLAIGGVSPPDFAARRERRGKTRSARS
jgi:ATP-dependent Lhr-like helicase